MGKIIIYTDYQISPVDDRLALEYVAAVIQGGRISHSPKGDQYCYVTQFKDGTIVYAGKPAAQTDTFRLARKERQNHGE